MTVSIARRLTTAVAITVTAGALTVAGLVGAVSVPAVAAVPTATPPAATGSASPTVPLLTGGLLTVTGSESAATSWHADDGSVGVTSSASVDKVTNTYLFPVQYNDTPPLPASNFPDDEPGGTTSEALSWTTSLGAESTEMYGTDSNDQPFDWTCSWEITNDRPHTEVGFPKMMARAPAYSGPELTNPQCSDPAHPVQWAGTSAGEDAAQLRMPAKPSHTTALTSAVHIDTPPCASGAFPNCVGHDTFDGTISLHCLLCVSDISFRQLEDPTTGDSTLTDVPDTGTYDGNRVEVDATVTNVGSVPISTPVFLVDADTHQLIAPADSNWNPLQPITFPAGATTHVMFEWNTTGYAWQDGKPHSVRRVEVMTQLGGAYRDITVLPKPVVLVHGWNSNAANAWTDMKSLLQAQNPDWRGYAVGDNPTWSAAMNTDPVDGVTIAANAFTMGKYIESLRAHLGAQHVDVVAHSMGGLISRDYIATFMPKVPQPPDGQPVVSHLIMLGTPNLGSICAVDISAVAGLFGDATPSYQLRPDFIAEFDRTVTDQHGVPFSVEAGYGYPLLCNPYSGLRTDTVVTVKSAWWNYTDVDKIRDMHTSLTSDADVVTQFIKPRLAVSVPDPTGATPATTPAGLHRTARTPAAAAAPVDVQLAAASDATVAGHGSRSVTVTVPKNASLLDAVFTAPASVGATLTNPSGETVATQVAGSAAAAQAVRALTAAKPAAGRWTITLRNTGPTPAPALLGAALSGGGVTLRTTAVRNTATRRLVVTARLLHNGRAQRGVTVLADIRGTRKPLPALRLYDDGKHHDGKRGDGVYGAATGKLPAGTYFVDVKATKRSTVRITSVLSS